MADVVLRRQAQAFDLIGDAVMLTDLDGRVVDCNTAAPALFGHPRSMIIGRIRSEKSDPDLARRQWLEVLDAISIGGHWMGDIHFVRADGVRRVGATTIAGLYDGGVLVGTTAVTRDVTDERALASQLAAAEQRWRLTLDGAPTGIALVALDGTFVRVNHAVCEMVGYAEDTLAGMTFQQITHPDDLDADLTLLASLVAGEIERYTLDKRYIHSSGRSVWVALSVGLVTEPSTGEPMHFVAQITDISDRRTYERRLTSIIESATDAFVAIDANGHITDWNSAAESMFGWRRAEALGNLLADLIIPPDSRSAHRSGLARLHAGGAPRILDQRVELLARCRDGRRLPVELTVWRVEDGNEFYAFLRDVSDRVQAKATESEAARRQAAIIEAQLAIADIELTPEKVMQEVCNRAMTLTGATGAIVELRDGDEMVYRAVAGDGQPYLGMRMAARDSMSGLAITLGQVLVCDDTDTDPRVNTANARAVGMRSLIVAPVRHAGQVIGVIKVAGPRVAQFSGNDSVALESLAAPFGAAIANAWQLEATFTRATTDALTGLANRSTAIHELERALERQRRHGGYTAVLFLDLDGFKVINDAHGHDAGDAVLMSVAERLTAAVRTTDTPARYGGDEFVIVCESLAAATDAEVLADRLIEAVCGAYPLRGGRSAELGVSIGVAVAVGTTRATELLRSADQAMYKAKRDGGATRVIRMVAGDAPP